MPAAFNEFSLLLCHATSAAGSLLDVANALEVQPIQVWRWISEVERPTEVEILHLHVKLERLLRASAWSHPISSRVRSV